MPGNGDVLNGSELVVQDYDSTEHQACLIFSHGGTSLETSERPSKKRRISKKASNTGPEQKLKGGIFTPLLNGLEKPEAVAFRFDTYRKLWTLQEDRVDGILQEINAKTLNDVAAFINDATSAKYNDKIPTGLILAGPSIASHGLLFEQLAIRVRAENAGPVVILTSREATDLKTALKKLIRSATNQASGVDEEERGYGKGAKFLNYDLQILCNYVQKHGNQKVTIAFQDSEAFGGSLLGDLITLFNSWHDRIPFVLLFGVATSVEIFHEKLSRSTVRCLEGKKFDVERVEESLEKIFSDAVTGSDTALRLGAGLCKQLLERQKDHVQSVQAFVSSLKYAYMSHFYANPLSILLAGGKACGLLQKEHLEAIRNLPSFRTLAEKQLNAGRPDIVRQMLKDNELLTMIPDQIKECRNAASRLIAAIGALEVSRSFLSNKTSIPRSDLYVKAVSGELNGSVLVRELLLSIKKMSSDPLSEMLERLTSNGGGGKQVDELRQVRDQLRSLLRSSGGQEQQLRSEHDIRHETLRTTVVAQKVELSVQKAALSKQDAAYSKLVQQVHDLLEDYFSTDLISPHDLFLNEIFFYDLKSPHRDVFTPKPRFAIERALSAPHDYLDCNCCGVDSQALESMQPPTAILYQLYLESGSLVNVFDLWSAFYAVVGGEDGEDCDEANALALFYRAIAELKYLGMVKHSKKKTDHVTKLAWKGL